MYAQQALQCDNVIPASLLRPMPQVSQEACSCLTSVFLATLGWWTYMLGLLGGAVDGTYALHLQHACAGMLPFWHVCFFCPWTCVLMCVCWINLF